MPALNSPVCCNSLILFALWDFLTVLHLSDTGGKWEYETIHQLFIDFKKTNNSVRREVSNTPNEFGGTHETG
jgi:hypothetical protein